MLSMLKFLLDKADSKWDIRNNDLDKDLLREMVKLNMNRVNHAREVLKNYFPYCKTMDGLTVVPN